MAAEARPGDELETTSPVGTTVNVFNYTDAMNNVMSDGNQAYLKFSSGYYQPGNNSDNRFVTPNRSPYLNAWTGNSGTRPFGGVFTGIVENELGEDGYPVLKAGNLWRGDSNNNQTQQQSLAYLFDATAHDGKQIYTDVDGLFRINDQNYFEYDSATQFASLSEDGSHFTVRRINDRLSWIGTPDGNTSDPGYFPFNTMNYDGNGLDETWPDFHFGTTMTTRFLQTPGGLRPGSNDALTYSFSGDDDVWIFIDGKLVADLGGIHDAAEVTINFKTGAVTQTRAVDGQTFDNTTNLGKLLGLPDGQETLPDNTLHTLKFFYLERGQGESNMKLQFNLVTVPESNIIKTDAEGNALAGAQFALYHANENYEAQGEPIATGTTNAKGEIVLTDGEDKLVYFEDIYNRGQSVGENYTHYVLRETKAPNGYRKSADMRLLYDVETGSILSQNRWETGAFAEGILTATIAAEPGSGVDDPYAFPKNQPLNGRESAADFMNPTTGELTTGRFFAMVQRFTGDPQSEDDLGDASKWHAVYPAGDGSWRLAPNTSGYEGIVQAAQNGGAHAASVNTNGQYWISEMELPGNIEDYYHFVDANGGSGSDFSRVRWTVSFYFTTDMSDSWSGVNADNTRRLVNSDAFDRQFGASLQVTDMPNELYIQKYDELGKPVSGVEFELYSEDAIDIPNPLASLLGDKPSIKADATPLGSVTTVDDLQVGNQTYDGAAVYPGTEPDNAPLIAGKTYYLVESSVPDGYERNESIVEVRVTDTVTNDDGSVTGGEVLANATAVGESVGAKDGVSVVRGVGHLSPALTQFAHGLWSDQVVGGEPVFADSTLHDIKAVMQTTSNDNLTGWDNQKPEDTEKDPAYFHLTYGADNRVFDYGSKEADGQIHGVTDDGWSKLNIRQCIEHKESGQQYEELDKNLDLAPVFEGYTVVEFTNQTINDLEIAKTVDTDIEGLDISEAKNKEFEFELELKVPADPAKPGEALGWLKGDYEIKVVKDNPENTPIEDKNPIEVNQSGSTTFTLKHGQKAVIEGLPTQAKFTVTEKTVNLPGGFKVKSGLGGTALAEGATVEGTLADADDSTPAVDQVRAEYVNTYNAEPTTISIPVQKNLDAVDGTFGGGSFDFELAAPEGAPANTPKPVDMNGDDNRGQVTLDLADGAKEAQGKFEFANNAFTLPGTYTYYMFERQHDTNIPGITYSQALYKVEIKVTEADGKLSASAVVTMTHDDSGAALADPQALDPDQIAVFENVYNEKAASFTLSGTKVLTKNGVPSTPTAGDFTFKLTRVTAGAPMPGGTTGDEYITTNDEMGTFIVGPIAFTNKHAGQTFEYKLVEDSTSKPTGGWTYDKSEYIVTIAVSEDPDSGALVVKPSYTKDGEQADALVFENVYKARPATFTPWAMKLFNGRDVPHGEYMWFTVRLLKGDLGAVNVEEGSNPGQLTDDGVSTSVSNIHNGFEKGIRFPDLTISRPGDYTFEFFEKPGNEPGVTYDGHKATVTISVTDDGKGTLTAVEGDYDNSTADGDNNPYNNGAIDEVSFAFFINQYIANGSYELKGVKTIEGRNFKDGETLTFKVEAKDGAPLPSKVGKDGTIEFDTRANSNSRQLTFGAISLTQDHVAKGSLEYEIHEVDPLGTQGATVDGVTYDGQTYTLKLNLAVDTSGEIVATPELTTDKDGAGTTAKEIAFKNVYAPQSSSAEGKVGGSKILMGRPLKAGDFSFELVPDDTVPVKDGKTTAKLVEEGLIDMSAVTAAGPVKNQEPKDGAGSFEFEGITFKIPTDIGDTNWFRFYIREVLPKADDGTELTEKDGIKYDNDDALVRFRVQDKTGNGVLTVDSSVQDPVFINVYDPAPTSVSLEATKALDGRSLAEGEFEFELKDADGKVLQKKTNAADGKVKFDAISLTKEGEYTYTINEKIPDADKKNPSITYDEAVHTLTVKVTDNGTGALEHKFVVGDKEQDDQPEVKFTNTYKALPVSDTLTATKSVNDSDAGNAFVMKDGDFSFTLSKDDQVIETVSNKADGSITFNPLEFSAPGRYIYTLAENDVDDTKAPGVSKDATKYTITYEASDKDEQGNNLDTLRIASKTVEKSDSTVLGPDDPITFTNAYATGEATYAIGGTKTIVSSDPLATKREPANDEFEFVLEPVAGTLADGTTVDKANVPMPANLEQDGTKVVKNGGSAFTFGGMTYTQTGTYEYLVTEKPGTDPTIGYSQQQFKVVVTVVAAGEDPNTHKALLNATAAVSLNDKPATSIAFENTYTPAPVTTAIPGGTKTLEGRDMKEGEFGFVLKNSAGEVVETVANAADGTFAFSSLTFDKVGTYTYTVHEEHRGETLNGVTHDSAIYSIAVTVKDDPATHALVAEVAAGLEGKPVKSLDFTNTYEAAPTDVVLNASKVLTGRDLKDGEFAFEALDADGKKVSEATNTASGQVTFKSIRLDKPGTYTYKLREVAGSEKGMKYDDAEFTATVTVTDDGSGVLKAEIAYSADPVFKNVFTPEGGNGGNGGNPPSGGTGTTPPGGGSGTGDGDGKGDEILPATGDQSLAPMALAVMAAAGIALTAGGLALAKRRR